MRARTFDVVTEREVSRRRGSLYVPTRFEPRPERFAADGYHPSPASYRQWGEAIADLIDQHLRHDDLDADRTH
jgi:lysophospholipase L1-like esterase